MQPLPTDALKAVRQYLAATAPPFDFGLLYDSTSPQGLLLANTQLWRRGDVSRTEYLKLMSVVREQIPEQARGPAFTLLKILDWQPDPQGGASLLLSLRETDKTQAFAAAFRLDGPPWQVRGACVSGNALPAKPALLARILGELAAWGAHEFHPQWVVSGLAASYLRHSQPLDVPLLALPEARFTCQNLGVCCSLAGGWELPVDSNALQALSRIDWEALGVPGPEFALRSAQTLPASHGDTRLYRLAGCADGNCQARVNGRCSIHQTLGWQPIEVCNLFPYQFLATPDGVCVTTSFLCHTVGDNIGKPLAENDTELRRKLATVQHLVMPLPDRLPLSPDGGTITWPAWRTMETYLLDLLADRTMGDLEARVARGTQLMAALIAMGVDQALVDEAFVRDLLQRDLPELRPYSALRAEEMAAIFLHGRDQGDPYSPFDGSQYGAWKHGKGKSLGPDRDDELATRYLRTVLFRKLGMVINGPAFVWGTVAWAARAWDRQSLVLAIMRDKPIDHELQRDTARHLDYGLINLRYLEWVAFNKRLTQYFVDPRTWISLGNP